MIRINVEKGLHGAHQDMKLDVELEIAQGEFLALSGKSGSGKTTLLRILAGLENAQGEIVVNSENWLDKTSSLQVQKRHIGFVFQEHALFENMSVLENLLFVQDDRELAEHLLTLTELNAFQERYPSSLSGGQKQRVSLCRAMMRKPKLLLLDEPLSALDPLMRKKLQEEILALHKEFQTTTIMVSHDPSEIYKLASRVLVLDNGKIINDGTPREVLLKTKGSQKLSFMGELLSLKKVDVIYTGVVAIGQQLVEVALSSSEAEGLHVGDRVNVNTKAFSPTLS